MKIIYTVIKGGGWCGFIKTLAKKGYSLTIDYCKALSVNSDNKHKTALAIKHVISEGKHLIIQKIEED